MESSKVIHAFYNDDEILMDAVKAVKAEHHHIEEVFCPFPVHGLDKAMGLAPTRLAITAFFYGITGLAFAIWMTNYMMIQIGHKILVGNQVFLGSKTCQHLCQLCLN